MQGRRHALQPVNLGWRNRSKEHAPFFFAMQVVVWRGASRAAGTAATRREVRREPRNRDVSCTMALQWPPNGPERGEERRVRLRSDGLRGRKPLLGPLCRLCT